MTETYKILIAEDTADFLKLICELLEVVFAEELDSGEIEIISAASLEKALDLTERHRELLVATLTDTQMSYNSKEPEKVHNEAGIEIVAKSKECLLEPVTCIMSANDQNLERAKADQYFNKPKRFEEAKELFSNLNVFASKVREKIGQINETRV